MTRGNLRAAVWVAALAVGAASPAWAQRGSAERADPDSRTTAGTGSAVDRSSGSSTPSSSGSASSTPSSGGSGGGGWSAPSASTPSSSSTANYVSVPVRPNQAERGQRARGGNGGEGRDDGGSARAVPRGSDRAAGSTSSIEGRASGASADGSAPSRRAVPTYSRPRDGNGTGTAVDRTYPYSSGNTATYYYSYPGYYSGRYYSPGYAFGLGYLYDPGWYDPYYYGSGYGGGYGGGYAGGGYQGGYGSSSYGRGPSGSLRLKIEPKQAQVYVDGYFVGVVDSFDGIFQKLAVDAGGHRIEIKAPGFETISFDVLITPNETVTYKGELRRMP
jgi:hypothetical protein